MKKILFVYPKMMIGGSTTSLLSILNNINLEKYEVDLLLAEHKGELMNHIPKGVNLLPPAIPDFNLLRKKKMFNIKYLLNFMKSRFYTIVTRNKLVSQQISAADNAELSLNLSKKYDIAISFLELWPTYYVAKRVNAKKKIGWIHVDYKSTGFLPKLDMNNFSRFDNIVLISKTCHANFNQLFPEFVNKTLYVENILSQKRIRTLAKDSSESIRIDPEKFNIVSVCRIDYQSKALDRTVEVFNKLKIEKKLHNVHWYIIGDGPQYNDLKELIKRYNLENVITLIGKLLNPHNIVSKCDAFLLSSYFEGKPMAVTEAMMLGVPPIVTAYSSAKEQIKHGYNGLIFENNFESIYEGLKRVILNQSSIVELKNNLISENYTNTEEMEKIYNLFNN